MRMKGFFKVVSVIVALSLMLSALPINFLHFLSAGESFALETNKYNGMKQDESGNILNFEEAAYTVKNQKGNMAYIWISENENSNFGRSYIYDIYCQSSQQSTSESFGTPTWGTGETPTEPSYCTVCNAKIDDCICNDACSSAGCLVIPCDYDDCTIVSVNHNCGKQSTSHGHSDSSSTEGTPTEGNHAFKIFMDTEDDCGIEFDFVNIDNATNCTGEYSQTLTPIEDNVFENGGKMNKVSFTLLNTTPQNSTIKFALTIKDSNAEIAGKTFLAFQYGDGEVEKTTFPQTGIALSPASDIKFVNADANGVIKFTAPENLKVNINVEKMDGPYEMWLFEGDLSGVEFEKELNKTSFDEALTQVQKYALNNGIEEGTQMEFTTSVFVLDKDVLKTDVSNTYTLLLRDKHNHATLNVFRTERETVMVKVSLVTVDADGKQVIIANDANGNAINSVEYLFLTKEGNSAKLSKAIPAIYGYVFKNASTGNVLDNVLTKDVLTDTEISLVYEVAQPGANVAVTTPSAIISPTNDLNKVTKPNKMQFVFDAIANNGNTDFNAAELVISLPTQDPDGLPLLLENINFVTGTYTNMATNAALSVYEVVDGNEVLVKADIDVTASETVAISSNATAIKLKFSENAYKKGANVGTKPEVSATLNYAGFAEEFDIELVAEFNATYLDALNAAQPVNAKSTASVKVYNPVYKLTVQYVDLTTGESIKEEVVKEYQAYDKIDVSLAAPKVSKYIFDNTKNLTSLESYVEANGTAYMPAKDVNVVHGYYAIRPYLANTEATTQEDFVYENDKQSFYFNGLGAYHNPTTQEGNATMFGFEMLFAIPKEFSIKTLHLPAFAGEEIEAKIFYRYAGTTAWTEYKIDTNGQEVTVSSLSETTVLVSSMYSKGRGAIEIKVVYGDSATPLPEGFKAQQIAEIYGVVNSDDVAELKVGLTTSTSYMLENSEKTYSKNCEAKCSVYQPAVSNVDASANLSTLESELYKYNFNNIKNTGTSALKDFTFQYTMPEYTYLDAMQIGKLNNATNTTATIVLRDANGNVLKTLAVDVTNGYDGQFNSIIDETPVKTIEVIFPDAPVGFECEGGIAITFHTTWSGATTSHTLKGTGMLSAVWTSEHNAENSNQILKTFSTTTKVSRFSEFTSDLAVSDTVALKGQIITATPSIFTNKYDIEVFNANALYKADDLSPVVGIKTGAYIYTTEFQNAKLIIVTYDEEGKATEIYNMSIPTKNKQLAVPDGTVAVQYLFTMLPANMQCSELATIDFRMKADKETNITEEFEYAVGTIELNKYDLTISEMAQVGNKHNLGAAFNIEVATPVIEKPQFTLNTSGYFNSENKHVVSGIKNDGNTNLYQTTLTFSAHESIVYTNAYIGEWKYPVSGFVAYGENGSNEVTVVATFNNVTTYDLVVLQDMSTNANVYIVLNTLVPANEMLSDAYCTSKFANNVAPAATIEVGFVFDTYYGVVKNGDQITEEEMKELQVALTDDAKQTVTVVRPAVLYPQVSVSADTIPYRGQFQYTISNIKNVGNTTLSNLEIINMFSEKVRFISMQTPTFNELVTYSIYYRVNGSNDWVLLQGEINARESIEVFAPELSAGQYITDIKLVLDKDVAEQFASESDWIISCINWSDAYSIDDVINIVAVNGYFGEDVANGKFEVAYTPQIPSILKADFTVNSPEKVYPGQRIELTYANIKNVTEATIERFTLTQTLDEHYDVIGLYTGTYESAFASDKLMVLYKTNLSNEGETFKLADNIDMSINTYLEFPKLAEGEYITSISLRYGNVAEGFTEIETPVIIVTPNESLENETTYTLDASCIGEIDKHAFGEVVTIEYATEFGFVNVVAKDEKDNELATYKVYGNVGEEYLIEETTLKGYQTLSAHGDTSGTYLLNETGNIVLVCKEVPKTGVEIITSWNFIAGAALLMAVGIVSLIPERKKQKTI